MSTFSFQNLEAKADAFVSPLLSELKASGLNIAHCDIDHVCWRVSSLDYYHAAKVLLRDHATLLSEAMIAGRPICTFRLHNALRIDGYTIDTLELPAPKANAPYDDGFEHIEIVIDESFEDIAARLKLPLDTRKPSALNQELSANLKSGHVKFHHMALCDVIHLEEQSDVAAAIESIGFIKALAKYHPFLSGSRPLNVHRADSDMDVLFCADDISAFKKDLEGLIPSQKLSWRETQKYGVPSFVTEAHVDGVRFEFFVQNVPTVKQISNLHYLIESRLIRLYGESLRTRVKELKVQGTPTEPAFAKALNLVGDPYHELLRLRKLSESAIRHEIRF